MVLIAFAATLIGVLFVRWLWSRRHLYRMSWQMPGPIGLPFIGSAYHLITQESLDFVEECSLRYEHLQLPFCVWLGTELFVYVDTEKAVEQVLTSTDCLDRQRGYKYIREGLGVDGVFTLNGPKWKHHRRLVSPSFNYNVVLSYLPVFNKNCRFLVDGLTEKTGGETFNIRDVIVHTMMNLFLDATFGSSMATDDKRRFKEYIAEGQGIIAKRMFLPWYQIEWIWNLTNYQKRMKMFTAFGRKLIRGLIDDTIKNGSANVTFLERLIRVADENADFELEDVHAEAMNTLTAAADTSGWAVAFTLLMLAINPDIQDRVVDEMHTVFPRRDTPVEGKDLDRLELLDRCLLETLRLFPVVTIMARTCVNRFKLQGFEIEPGTSIAIGIRQIHRSKLYWGERAHIFDPDNFLPERVKSRSRFTYIPFAAGPRNCIGEKYAMTVMKVVLTHILRNFRVTTQLKMEELRVRMDINIHLIGGHQMQVHPRDYPSKQK